MKTTTPADVLRAVYRRDLGALARLSPAEADAIDEDGRTPLMHAVLAEDADPALVALLIARGADVRARDRAEGWTALHFAARDGAAALAGTLLEAGAPVDAADCHGNTPLWRCVANGVSFDAETARTLLRHGADPERVNRAGVSPRDLARRFGIDLTRLQDEAASPPPPAVAR